MKKLNYTGEQLDKAVSSRDENPTIERMCLLGCYMEGQDIVSLI